MGSRPEEGPTDATLWVARRSVGSDQGFSAGPRRPCGRDCGGQPIVRRSGSLPISSWCPLARSPRALWRLEDRLPALQSVVEERRFRAYFQAAGEDLSPFFHPAMSRVLV